VVAGCSILGRNVLRVRASLGPAELYVWVLVTVSPAVKRDRVLRLMIVYTSSGG